jgi:ribosomal protein S12 methylthiotransferase accessory factor
MLRSIPPEQTLKNIQPYIRLAGITRLADLTQLDCIGMPVYTAIRPMSKNLSTSQGKGITKDQAKVSAYMEAIEQYFAESVTIDKEIPLEKINPNEAIDIEKLPKGWLKANNLKEKINKWTYLQSLIENQRYLVPTELINFDLSTPCLENYCFAKSTTGLSSGNNYDEAICQALFEIIERNASAEFECLPKQKNKAY